MAGLGEFLACPLDDRLHVVLGHVLTDFPVNDEPAAAVEDAAHVVERSGDVEVGDVDVPVVVRLQRLLESRSFLGGLAVSGIQQAGVLRTR